MIATSVVFRHLPGWLEDGTARAALMWSCGGVRDVGTNVVVTLRILLFLFAAAGLLYVGDSETSASPAPFIISAAASSLVAGTPCCINNSKLPESTYTLSQFS